MSDTVILKTEDDVETQIIYLVAHYFENEYPDMPGTEVDTWIDTIRDKWKSDGSEIFEDYDKLLDYIARTTVDMINQLKESCQMLRDAIATHTR